MYGMKGRSEFNAPFGNPTVAPIRTSFIHPAAWSVETVWKSKPRWLVEVASSSRRQEQPSSTGAPARGRSRRPISRSSEALGSSGFLKRRSSSAGRERRLAPASNSTTTHDSHTGRSRASVDRRLESPSTTASLRNASRSSSMAVSAGWITLVTAPRRRSNPQDAACARTASSARSCMRLALMEPSTSSCSWSRTRRTSSWV